MTYINDQTNDQTNDTTDFDRYHQYLVHPAQRLSQAELKEALLADPEMMAFIRRAYKSIRDRLANVPNYADRSLAPQFRTDGKGGHGNGYESQPEFWNWLEDIQLPPDTYARKTEGGVCYWTVDRVDNALDYEPGNQRWASRQTQSRNTAMIRHEMVAGFMTCRAQLAETFGWEKYVLHKYELDQMENLRVKADQRIDRATLELVLYGRLHGLKFHKMFEDGLLTIEHEEDEGFIACLNSEAIWTSETLTKIRPGKEPTAQAA